MRDFFDEPLTVDFRLQPRLKTLKLARVQELGVVPVASGSAPALLGRFRSLAIRGDQTSFQSADYTAEIHTNRRADED